MIEKPLETSLNSIANSNTKVIFSSVSENRYAEHKTNHAILDVSGNTDTIKYQ